MLCSQSIDDGGAIGAKQFGAPDRKVDRRITGQRIERSGMACRRGSCEVSRRFRRQDRSAGNEIDDPRMRRPEQARPRYRNAVGVDDFHQPALPRSVSAVTLAETPRRAAQRRYGRRNSPAARSQHARLWSSLTADEHAISRVHDDPEPETPDRPRAD